MRVAVVGAGAIGGFLGARLALAGVRTSALARGATLKALRHNGWRLRDEDGEHSAPTRASGDAAELGPQDLVVVAVKAQSLRGVVGSIGPLLGPETVVLTAMNGMPWWFFNDVAGACHGLRLASVDPDGAIAAAIEGRRVVGGVVHLSCDRPEPGVVAHHGGRELIIGEPDHRESGRARAVAELLSSAGLDVSVSSNIHADVWYKLWGAMTINPVSALTGATVDLILDDDLVRAWCETAMVEVRRVGERIGCPITQTPAERNDVARKLGAFRTSMLQDAEAGRSLELDALVGAVREIGAVVGVPTPTVDALYGLTRLSARVREH
ncbi:2-dehydropantoate 2-reductase [Kutzneria sp. NPDC052558]|uniref:2-dehydropantoate 2-reductase n=1 Tax=Kutzneria sp. NPDC052558 TaxID=3364121 RepID=UPI0037C97FFC